MSNQLNLFQKEVYSNPIAGLSYHPNYISQEEEAFLFTQIDAQNWLLDLKRRVQHYGYKYDYRARRIDVSMKIGTLPSCLENIAKRLYTEGVFEDIPDQVIVNEYEPGQGISPHIDCEPCFEDTIVSISLNSTAVMEFCRNNIKIPILLEPRSAVILKGESRYEWTHSIPARQKDVFENQVFQRKRRVSLTFRKVIL
ncbi:MAG: alpha-ketoglutarate-dependent dioxygenase AlkB [Saprospiraceae bacterium]|nr:alpha-ketoglutarate-dependent dioxygenase AlkB [Saprospiraceae bacterium]